MFSTDSGLVCNGSLTISAGSCGWERFSEHKMLDSLNKGSGRTSLLGCLSSLSKADTALYPDVCHAAYGNPSLPGMVLPCLSMIVWYTKTLGSSVTTKVPMSPTDSQMDSAVRASKGLCSDVGCQDSPHEIIRSGSCLMIFPLT